MKPIFFSTRKSKFSNKKITVGQHTFDSKLENKIYAELSLEPDIQEIILHKKIKIKYKDTNICTVIPDYILVLRNGTVVAADAKCIATETAVSNLKFKLLKAFYGLRVFKLPKEFTALRLNLKKKQKTKLEDLSR